MPMTGIYHVQIWEFHCLSGEPKTIKKKSVSSVEELYNEIEKSIALVSNQQILSKVLKLGIWPNQLI
jgi:hypothetical protein